MSHSGVAGSIPVQPFVSLPVPPSTSDGPSSAFGPNQSSYQRPATCTNPFVATKLGFQLIECIGSFCASEISVKTRVTQKKSRGAVRFGASKSLAEPCGYMTLSSCSKFLRSVFIDDDAHWAKKLAKITLCDHLGHLEKLNFFIAMDCNTDVADQHGRTPLQTACQNSHLDVVMCLIAAGCNTEAADRDGRTPLLIACVKGHRDVVKCLIAAGCNKDAAGRDGRTPLLIACGRGHLDVADCLIAAGCNKEAADRDGRTPLQIA